MSGDQSDNPRQEGLPFKEVQSGGIELSANKDRTPSIDRVIGEVVDGRYQLLSAVGQGGMGYVYKAKQLTTGRTLAIKMLSSKASATDAHMMRFQQEAKAACAFSHPNAVHVYDFGITSDSVPYLTMQYVEGQTMSDAIAHNGALAQGQALLIFQQIASALSAAHEQHVLHRDIKPSNIMLVPIKEPPHISAMLLDFGIAKLDDPEQSQLGLTKTGEVFGTPFYMSPEQCKGQKLDQRSDIYSLGCVMYEALTGVPPFYGENFLQILHRHINDDPVPLTAMRTNGTVSPGLQKIVLRCLAKNPEQRFQTMADLKVALSNANELSSDNPEKKEHTSFSSHHKASAAASTKLPGRPTRASSDNLKKAAMIMFVCLIAAGALCGVGKLWTDKAPATVPNEPSVVANSAAGIQQTEAWQKSFDHFCHALDNDDSAGATTMLKSAVDKAHSQKADNLLVDALRKYAGAQQKLSSNATNRETKRLLAKKEIVALRQVSILAPGGDALRELGEALDSCARNSTDDSERRALLTDALNAYSEALKATASRNSQAYVHHQTATLKAWAATTWPGESAHWRAEAIAELKKAIELDAAIYSDKSVSLNTKQESLQQLANEHFWLGNIHQDAGEIKEALTEYETAEPLWRRSKWNFPLDIDRNEIAKCRKKLGLPEK